MSKASIIRKEINSTLPQENYRKFFDSLIALCNETRITIVIQGILELKTKEKDGKLLDVSGFTYQKVGESKRIIVPIFVDTMHKD